ncbi:hypothetical protein BH23ACT12_BH23ACT12_15190 [soil metagenome]
MPCRGVEVLFGFQFGLSFTQRFNSITSLHRLRSRQFDKDKLLRLGNRMLVFGLIFLAGPSPVRRPSTGRSTRLGP